MRHLLFVLTVFVGALALSGGARAADPIQPLESIREAARSFLAEQTRGHDEAEVTVAVGRLDRRLRLRRCDDPLEAFLPRGGRLVGNVTVGVRCAGPKPWSIYVQGEVRMMGEVVVAARSLPRGATVGPDDIELDRRDLSRLTSGYVTAVDTVVGMKLRRSVSAGLALNETLLEAPVAVRRGERVTILARGAGLEVRMEGEALTAGAPGEIIRVRNRSSEREIEAQVVGPGVVEIRM